MQTSIFVCNNVCFGGIFHANESQTCLPIPCSKTLQIIASIFANYSACKHQFSFAKICVFSRYISCKRKPYVPAKCLLKNLANYSVNLCNKSACKHQFSFAIMCILVVYFMQMRVKLGCRFRAQKPCKL